MTPLATASHAAQRLLDDRYRRLRTTHPVTVLEWLRNGVLLSVLAAALLYLWVAIQASNDIAAARRTHQAITDIGSAIAAASSANAALSSALNTQNVLLTGTGSIYVGDINTVSKNLTLAVGGNAAGQEGTSSIQFAQAQLQTYLTLSEDAISDDVAAMGGPVLGIAAEGYAYSSYQNLIVAIGNLKKIETTAFSAQLDAWPLDPGAFWWALLGPVVVMLLLTVATAHVLAHHFRRYVSRWLWRSLLVTTATAVTVGIFNWIDERHLSPDPWAGHPATLTFAMLLFLVAAVMAYVAYRPRLAQYRFESS